MCNALRCCPLRVLSSLCSSPGRSLTYEWCVLIGGYPGVCMCPPGRRCLYLSDNSLSGTIPDGMSTLTSLRCVMVIGATRCPLLPADAVAAALVFFSR